MPNLSEHPEIVKSDPRPAMYEAARKRLDALRSADLPDDITPLQVLEHCRRKRLSARRVYEDMLKREVPRSDPRRIKAVVALELAEAEAELFLDRWLDDLAPWDGEDAFAAGNTLWLYIFEQRNRWRAEVKDAEIVEYEWIRTYYEADAKLLSATFRAQYDQMESKQLEALWPTMSDWAKQHYHAVKKQHGRHITVHECVEYIERLDYYHGVERKVDHAH